MSEKCTAFPRTKKNPLITRWTGIGAAAAAIAQVAVTAVIATISPISLVWLAAPVPFAPGPPPQAGARSWVIKASPGRTESPLPALLD
jgi:hypothetical protein